MLWRVCTDLLCDVPSQRGPKPRGNMRVLLPWGKDAEPSSCHLHPLDLSLRP